MNKIKNNIKLNMCKQLRETGDKRTGPGPGPEPVANVFSLEVARAILTWSLGVAVGSSQLDWRFGQEGWNCRCRCHCLVIVIILEYLNN